jgi:hypothetical protein
VAGEAEALPVISISLIAMLLAITPEECNSRIEWCYCRQYVAMMESRCEDRVLRSTEDSKKQQRGIKQCLAEERVGRRACELDDDDNRYEAVEVGKDE